MVDAFSTIWFLDAGAASKLQAYADAEFADEEDSDVRWGGDVGRGRDARASARVYRDARDVVTL